MVCHMRHAFTLIELSIVLIIIGLLVGGILAGQGLIEAASIQSQANQLREYDVAYKTFQVKFGDSAIPGDYDRAADAIAGATSGNGDQLIENDNPVAATRPLCRVTYANEQPEFFIQLSNAGLLKGSFDGTQTLGTGFPELKMNKGKGMSGGSSYSRDALYTGMQLLASQDPTRRAILCLNLGDTSQAAFSNMNRRIGVATAQQMLLLDTKIDDGAAKGGRLIALRPDISTEGDCTNASPHDEYNISDPDETCHAIYVLDE